MKKMPGLRFKISLLTLGMVMLLSCADKTYEGDGYKNYPDMKMILEENFKAMKNANLKGLLCLINGTQKDTQRLESSAIPWEEWKKEMLLADINKESFDHQYKIDAVTDTLVGTITYMYQSLKPDNFTKKIIITSRSWDEAITSIYVETHDEGFFSSSSSKILFAFGRSFQIQHYSKQPFSKAKETVKTLLFVNPER